MSRFDNIKYYPVKRYFSTTSSARGSVYLFARFLSKLSPRTFPVAISLSKIYLKTNNRFAAEEIIRLYASHSEMKLRVAKELFRLGSYYKVVKIFSELDYFDLEKKYGIPAVEIFGDAYFSLRKFKEALTSYEYVISRVAGARLSRIKSAECYYQLFDFDRSKFRLRQYKDRFGSNARVEALETMLNMQKPLKKKHEFNNYLNLKYGIKIHHKVEIF